MANLFRRYYNDIDPDLGFFKVSIDGSTPQRLIWSDTSHGPGRHKLTLMHDDTNQTSLGLDFFRSVINNIGK